MAARKGTRPPNAGKGRRKGVPNKTTSVARNAFNDLLEDNIENAQTWLDRVAQKNPGYALELLLQLAEYCVPKLSRTEIKANPVPTAAPFRLCIFPDGGPGQTNNPPRTHEIDDYLNHNDSETPE